jgi:hypothetical protein
MNNYFIALGALIHSFINSSTALCWALASSFNFVIFFTQMAGLLGRVISPSQGSYLHTGQHIHRINAQTDIHALSGIRTHDPSVRSSEDSSCLRQNGHCDRPEPFYRSDYTIHCVTFKSIGSVGTRYKFLWLLNRDIRSLMTRHLKLVY